MNPTEKPRYRILPDNWIAVNGIPEGPGREFESPGWPPNNGHGIEPINETARRIFAWWTTNRSDPFLPAGGPFNRDHQRYYLPGVSADPSSQMIYIVPPDRILPGMPAYRALRAYEHTIWAPRRRFSRNIAVGEVVVTLRWPTFDYGEFEPANNAAEKVIAYLEEHSRNPRLLPSPWDCFSEAIFLPDLPTAAVSAPSYGSFPPAASDLPIVKGRNRIISARKPTRAA